MRRVIRRRGKGGGVVGLGRLDAQDADGALAGSSSKASIIAVELEVLCVADVVDTGCIGCVEVEGAASAGGTRAGGRAAVVEATQLDVSAATADEGC